MINKNKNISRIMADIRPAGKSKQNFEPPKAATLQWEKIPIKPEELLSDEVKQFQNFLRGETQKKTVPEEFAKPVENKSSAVFKEDEGKNPIKYFYAGKEFFESKKENYFDEIGEAGEIFGKKEEDFSWRELFAAPGYFVRQFHGQLKFSFALVACGVFLFIFGAGFFGRGMKAKNSMMQSGQSALASLSSAQNEILNRNFQKSTASFAQAEEDFGKISAELGELGGILVGASRYVPILSKLSSGARLAEAGGNISRIGILAGETAQYLSQARKPLQSAEQKISLLELFRQTEKNSQEILALLEDTEKEISGVNIDDIPADQRQKFLQLKNTLPSAKNYLQGYVENGRIWTDVLGGNGPRKYLFLFQNNQEMRATGGFIGTYGLLDIFNGHVRNFFIDGIFNPDGQLTYKVVPPAPIQKISAAWSLHDSNWFPDFPVSAEKAIWFFEKTGGSTADGVIAMTPAVMQKLLAITGSIEMPEYGVMVDSDNFVEKIQYEVEYDYDKELNQPKKIIADLAPKVMEKIFNLDNAGDAAKVGQIILESFAEKQILLYSKNYEIEKLISGLGWSGEILETQKDYLSVINTNINGYKTDGVIEEKIDHTAEIQADGSIIDTVEITRHHNGGNSEFDWWNKVNADYQRVYVPQGSVLLGAEGQTREFNAPPLDYDTLRFKRDPQVQMEEDATRVDEESGTRIYADAGKTVFANWVYVSPQETATVRYRYLLPFKLDLENNKSVETFSLLAQKQAGSLGSQFGSKIIFPAEYKINWKYPEQSTLAGNNLELQTNLKTDKFIGVAFTK